MIIVMCYYWDAPTTHLCLSIIYLRMPPICFPAHPLHQSNIPPWPCSQPDVATPCFDERSSHQFLPTFARFVVWDPGGRCGGFWGHQIELYGKPDNCAPFTGNLTLFGKFLRHDSRHRLPNCVSLNTKVGNQNIVSPSTEIVSRKYQNRKSYVTTS